MQYGGPAALEVLDVPEQHAGPGQVRLRVHAAAVNPTDTYVRNGDRAEIQKADPPPYVPGMDAAGVVDEVGPGVGTGIEVGDRAMAIVLPRAPTAPTARAWCCRPSRSPGRRPAAATPRRAHCR